MTLSENGVASWCRGFRPSVGAMAAEEPLETTSVRLLATRRRFSSDQSRQGEAEDGAARHVRRSENPPTVGVDNRAADRQSHAHAAGLD
jgi:hypothetical protein